MKLHICPNPSTPGLFQDVCRLTCCIALLNSPLTQHLVFPTDASYQPLVSAHYGSNWALNPGCFFQPDTAQDLSVGVSLLSESDNGQSECHFAVRGGGHMGFKGASSVDSGVTIDLEKLSGTSYNAEKETVTLGGGTKWGDVYETLKPLGVAVTGGRDVSVGVGGLVLGGGLSYFAPEKGLACDNVVNFEVVLSNGSIINANPQTHTDLFRALKGGGNNFGIVTQVELRAFKSGPLWGGLIGHHIADIPDQIKALVNFLPKLDDHPKAQLVTIWQHGHHHGEYANFAASGLQYTNATEVEAHEESEKLVVFKDFLNLDQTFHSLRTTDIHDLMTETAPPAGKRGVYLTLTFKNKAHVLRHLRTLHEVAMNETDLHAKSREYDITVFLQPWPVVLAKHGRDNGGNVLGLERMVDDDHIVLLFFLAWNNPRDDHFFENLAYGLIHELKAYTVKTKTDSDYIYFNYAGVHQNPLRGYGEENLKFLKKVAKEYDPFGVFQRQVPGGFKVSRA